MSLQGYSIIGRLRNIPCQIKNVRSRQGKIYSRSNYFKELFGKRGIFDVGTESEWHLEHQKISLSLDDYLGVSLGNGSDYRVPGLLVATNGGPGRAAGIGGQD
jgi:hypothetical protein